MSLIKVSENQLGGEGRSPKVKLQKAGQKGECNLDTGLGAFVKSFGNIGELTPPVNSLSLCWQKAQDYDIIHQHDFIKLNTLPFCIQQALLIQLNWTDAIVQTQCGKINILKY